jgi:hypothetical protein
MDVAIASNPSTDRSYDHLLSQVLVYGGNITQLRLVWGCDYTCVRSRRIRSVIATPARPMTINAVDSLMILAELEHTPCSDTSEYSLVYVRVCNYTIEL